MTQSDFGTINPASKSGTQLATDLNNFRDAQNTQHAGSSAPSYVQAGMLWVDNASADYILKLRDGGGDDIPIARIDATDNIGLPGSGYAFRSISYLTTGVAQTYTPPAGCRAIEVLVVGGGGGGGGVDGQGAGTAAVSGAGSAGGWAQAFITALAASYTYTVGAGGAGGAAGNNNGSAGSNTTFTDGTSTLTGGGGNAGTGDLGASSGALVGASGVNGGLGVIAGSWTGALGAGGAATAYRRQSGNDYSLSLSGASIFGGSEGAQRGSDGRDARTYGAGGGSCAAVSDATNYAGGAGADGIIVIREYY